MKSDLSFIEGITRIGNKCYGYIGREDVNGMTYSIQELTGEELRRFNSMKRK